MPKIRQNYEKYELEGLQKGLKEWRKEAECDQSYNAFALKAGFNQPTAQKRTEEPRKFSIFELRKINNARKISNAFMESIMKAIGWSEKDIREFAKTYIAQ